MMLGELFTLVVPCDGLDPVAFSDIGFARFR